MTTFEEMLLYLDSKRGFLSDKMEWARRQIETGEKLLKTDYYDESLINEGTKWLDALKIEVKVLDAEYESLKPSFYKALKPE